MAEVLEKVSAAVQSEMLESTCCDGCICCVPPCHCATRFASAAIAALEAVGFVVMPMEPTQEMSVSSGSGGTRPLLAVAIYKAMVDVRPRLIGEG